MEIHEVINLLLKNKGMTKREFARQLIAYAPRLKNTGETPSEQAIYHYLAGRLSLKVELIPCMSDILGVSEQELFDWSERRRVQLLQSILKNPSKKELSTAEYILNIDKSININNNDGICFLEDEHFDTAEAKEVASLLKYAPKQFLADMKRKLLAYKRLGECD